MIDIIGAIDHADRRGYRLERCVRHRRGVQSSLGRGSEPVRAIAEGFPISIMAND
jgi:hypothetical protein